MSKKQRERKQRKEQQKRPGATPPRWGAGKISPEARKIMDEIGRGELYRNETKLYELVTNSMILREEPEFLDYEFDVDEATRIVTPLLAAKEQELKRAREVSEQEYYAVYEEVRMQGIEALLTRERRREFLRRYDQMLSRLLAGAETDKITTALVTRSIFDQKGFPWGLAGLVAELFEEAREAVIDRVDNIEKLVIESLKKQHPEMTDAEMQAILDDPERREEAITEIDPSPETLAELQEITNQVMEDFERTLYDGSIPLNLFSDDEIAEVAERLNMVTAQANLGDAEPGIRDMEAVARMLQAYIGEIMTPERQAKLTTDLTRIIGEWEQALRDASLLLEMERDSLNEVKPGDNQFIYAALVGQLRRASEDYADDELENAEGELDGSVIDGKVIDSH